MKVVHQGSVLSALLSIIVLEALSREFRAGVPWEDLYADDLVIIADSQEECVRRLLIWKEAMEKKGLRENAGKTKGMIGGTGLDLLQSSGKYSCAVCRTVLLVCLFCCFTSQVNSYGHCGTVSSPNHTFSWAGLNKRLISNSCTYFRL